MVIVHVAYHGSEGRAPGGELRDPEGRAQHGKNIVVLEIPVGNLP
jgi:hypothetical protein